MKTALVTTCWLGTDEYVARLNNWLHYYQGIKGILKYDDIIILDNASSFKDLAKTNMTDTTVYLQRFTEHYARPSHYDYMYLWRAVDFYKDLFKEYGKIIYMDNDFYIISGKMVDDINQIHPLRGERWVSPWCPRHKFPETGLQIITNNALNYYKNYPWTPNNGKCMEHVLPVEVNYDWKGDRHSEYGQLTQKPDWDFSAQVTTNMNMEFKP